MQCSTLTISILTSPQQLAATDKLQHPAPDLHIDPLRAHEDLLLRATDISAMLKVSQMMKSLGLGVQIEIDLVIH